MDDEITVQEFMRRWEVFVDIGQVSKRPDGLMSDSATHWACDVWRAMDSNVRISAYYSQGKGCKEAPTARDILSCLADDVRSYESYNTGKDIEDWVSWADDMGMFDQSDNYGSYQPRKKVTTKTVIVNSIKGWKIMSEEHAKFKEMLGEEGFAEFLRLEQL